MLIDQYKPIYSTKNNVYIYDEINNTYVKVTEEDIIIVMSELKENSAPGPDGFPVIFQKKT